MNPPATTLWFRYFLAFGVFAAPCESVWEAAAASPSAGAERFYIGTYTGNGSVGVYQAGLDLGTGTFSPTNLAGTMTSPSFLALHPGRRFLYAVNENGGKVAAFSVDAGTGSLTFLNQQDSNGANPCHVVVDRTGRNVLVANYTGGSVTVFPLLTDGRLATASSHIQHAGTGPHAHCVTLDPQNRFALVCDLGLDRIFCYRFDPALGTLTPNTTPWTSVAAGSGPRHLVFDPHHPRAYAICELNATITGFGFDSTNGTLAAFQTVSALPVGYSGQKSAAEIAFHPSGRFLYGSNRGNNTIVVFAVDPGTGALTQVQQQPTGQTPRHFAIDPAGAFCLVACQGSDDIRLYSIDPQSGLLATTNQRLTVSKPVCVLPLLTQPPQPTLNVRSGANGEFAVGLGRSLEMLSYELYQTTTLDPGMTWTLLATGVKGQTDFVVTTPAAQGFLRACVLTDY